MKAFVCRIAPRIIKDGRPRGTLVEPGPSPNFLSDHRLYYTQTIVAGKLPSDLLVEFGQPPVEAGQKDLKQRDVIILLVGSDDVDGGDNERGIVGIGRVNSTKYQGSGTSERCVLEITDVVEVEPMLSKEDMDKKQYFAQSDIASVGAFGFRGAPQAHNLVRFYSKSEDDAPARLEKLAGLLGMLAEHDPNFPSKLEASNADLLAMLPPLDPHWRPVPTTTSARVEASFTNNPAKTVQELAERLFLDQRDVLDMIWNLEHYKSLILTGPPGVGKTHVARELAAYFAGPNVSFVQFHPSFAYEYFISGYRPDTDVDGRIRYELTPGILLNAINDALPENDAPLNELAKNVLIIDEINRSNVSAVFGEFMSAMEYRGRPHALQYGNPLAEDNSLTVPENFFIIATMNKADRSAGNFDSALRRRFGFYDCNPKVSPFIDVLDKFLVREHPEMRWLSDNIKRINEVIPDPDFALGASYFMGMKNLDSDTVERIMTFKIRPFLHAKFGDKLFHDHAELFDLRPFNISVSTGQDRHDVDNDEIDDNEDEDK